MIKGQNFAHNVRLYFKVQKIRAITRKWCHTNIRIMLESWEYHPNWCFFGNVSINIPCMKLCKWQCLFILV